VTWIAWFSSFRGSGLRIGDRITHVGGGALDPLLFPGKMHALIGQASESLGWEKRGSKAGDPLNLTMTSLATSTASTARSTISPLPAVASFSASTKALGASWKSKVCERGNRMATLEELRTAYQRSMGSTEPAKTLDLCKHIVEIEEKSYGPAYPHLDLRHRSCDQTS
jgi:hypothetical protein